MPLARSPCPWSMVQIGIAIKIIGRKPAIFQIEYFKKGNLLQIFPWLVRQKKYAIKCEIFNGQSNFPCSTKSSY